MYNPRSPGSSLEVRVILDSGSQWLYITNRVREILQLEAEGEQLMSIMTFRSKEETVQVCQAVKIGMRMRDSQEHETSHSNWKTDGFGRTLSTKIITAFHNFLITAFVKTFRFIKITFLTPAMGIDRGLMGYSNLCVCVCFCFCYIVMLENASFRFLLNSLLERTGVLLINNCDF